MRFQKEASVTDYSWISIIALFGYLFLLLAFASARKSKVIYSFMILQVIMILWTGGSFLMRIQFWPSVNFWHYVSIAGIMLVPYGFFRFFLDFLEEKRGYGKNFWLLFFVVCFIVNLFTESIMPTPEVVPTDTGVRFIYTYHWQIYIPIVASVLILIQIGRLFITYCKGDTLIARQMRPVLIGILIVVIGNVASTFPFFAGIPVDIISGVCFVYTLFYTLYRKRLFKLTLLASRGNCYVVAVLICMLIYYRTIVSLQRYLRQQLGLNEALTILVISIMMIATIYILYVIMKHFLDNLFVKEEQIQAETIKNFSYTVSKTLNKSTILSELVEVIQKMVTAERVYICVENENGTYVMERTASPLDNQAFQMGADHPLVEYMKHHDGCILMRDFRRTNSYRSMWEAEKHQLDQWGIECFASMKDSSDLVGIVMLSGKEKGRAYNFDDFSALMSVDSVCTMAVKNSRLYEQAYNEARKDELTDLYNRKCFYEVIGRQIEEYHDQSLALVMLSIDDFKLYNQLYGNQEGDLALQKIADIMRATTADCGTVFRLNGKEFAILLPGYDIYSAKILAESISDQVRRMNDSSDLYRLKTLTLSCGICAAPYMASTVDELITNADMAVYSAKRSGKNTVVMYSEDVEIREEESGSDQKRTSYYDTYASTIYALTAAIDTKDHYTFSHSQNVAYYAGELARAFKMNEECIDTVKEAGLLHDIGKIGIAEEILNKPGKLTTEEYEIMKSHVENSIGIIRHLPSLDYVIPAVLAHHERYDGHGYPRGVASEDIPVMGRILCVADSFDAMISKRSYKKAMSVDRALAILEEESGRQFDPKLVEIFTNLVRSGSIEIHSSKEEPEPHMGMHSGITA